MRRRTSRGCARRVEAEGGHAPAVGPQEAQQRLQEGGLARAVRAREGPWAPAGNAPLTPGAPARDRRRPRGPGTRRGRRPLHPSTLSGGRGFHCFGRRVPAPAAACSGKRRAMGAPVTRRCSVDRVSRAPSSPVTSARRFERELKAGRPAGRSASGPPPGRSRRPVPPARSGQAPRRPAGPHHQGGRGPERAPGRRPSSGPARPGGRYGRRPGSRRDRTRARPAATASARGAPPATHQAQQDHDRAQRPSARRPLRLLLVGRRPRRLFSAARGNLSKPDHEAREEQRPRRQSARRAPGRPPPRCG